jgi:mortality factor 4-like protein 1
MPELIAQTNMDQQSINRLREQLQLLTMYMAREENLVRFFSTDYQTVSNTYKNKISSGV